MAHSCFTETMAQERKNLVVAESSSPSPTTELEEAVRSWRGAAEVRATRHPLKGALELGIQGSRCKSEKCESNVSNLGGV